MNPYPNPYAAPVSPGPLMPTTPEEASRRVRVPAWIIIVSNGLSIPAVMLNGVVRFYLEPELLAPADAFESGRLVGTLIAWTFMLLVSALNLWGASRMLKLQSRTLAMAVCVLSCLPCNGCCWLGLVGGIWGLVVLNDEGVKAAFRG